MKAILAAIVLSVSLSLTGCGLGKTSHHSDSLAQTGSGVAIPGFDFHTIVVGFGNVVCFLASESGQGGTDLNGDGDPADVVLHCVNTDTGAVVNVAVSGRRPLIATASRVVWPVGENEEAATDFTGDGDIADQVLASYDPTLPVGPGNPVITAINVAIGTPLVAFGDNVVFMTSEADVMADLNGDTDTDDLVVRVFDATTGTVVLETGFCIDTARQTIVAGHGHAAWIVSEADQGGTDLNGDTDAADGVLFVCDLTALVTFPVGGIPASARAVAGLPVIMGTLAAPVIAYCIDESQEGNVSFNGNAFVGDTDTSDMVLALYDVATGTEALPFSGIAVDPAQVTGNATRCAFIAIESANTGAAPTDFNSDGDDGDEVAWWVNLAMPAMAFNLGLATRSGDAALNACDEWIVFLASEADQGAAGTNHNALAGDTDTSDDVCFYCDVSVTGVPPFNTGLAGDDLICFPGRFFTLTPESAQNGVDVNGDGDGNDVVPIYFIASGSTAIQGVEPILTDGLITFQVCPTAIRLFANARESAMGDMNHDGDTDDFHVLCTLLDPSNGNVRALTTVFTSDMDGTSLIVPVDADTVVFPFAEQRWGPGFDSNGDGDVSDTVLHYVNAPCL